MILMFRNRFNTKLFGPNMSVAKLKRYTELIGKASPTKMIPTQKRSILARKCSFECDHSDMWAIPV